MPTDTAEQVSPPADTGAPSLQEIARDVYRRSLELGKPLTDKALAAQFDRTDRWARIVMADVRAETGGTETVETLPPPEVDTPPAPEVTPEVPTGATPEATPEVPAPRRRGNGNGNGRRGNTGKPRNSTPRKSTPPPTPAALPAAPLPPTPWWRKLSGDRITAWAGFWFGSIMSIAANVLYTWLPADQHPAGWYPPIAQQVGAAVWPIALLLSVEVLSRVQWPNTWYWNIPRYGGAGLVAVASGGISYFHLNEVLTKWGYGELPSFAGPIVLDGLMVVSGFALLAMTRKPEGTAR